jgi:glycerophosphoryl diester phosphodiesterase
MNAIKVSVTFLIYLISALQANAQPNPLPKPRHRFTVIAHRGDHVKYPENTLAAYREAIRNGADYVEIDLRTTQDSALVSMHDGSITRMTGKPGNIKDLTLSAIKDLEIRSNDSTDTNIYRVPTFEEILKACKNKIYIYLDFKDASAAATCKVLRKYGMEKQVIVYINSATQFKDWRTVAPDMPLMLSLPDGAKDVNAVKNFVDQYHPDLLDGNWKSYNGEILKYLAESKLPAWPDIQSADEDKHWDEALPLGFTGLQTDHPAALIAHLKKLGLR